MDIEIEIQTGDYNLLNELFESAASPLQLGYQKDLSNGVTVTLKNDVKRRSISIPLETITLVLSIGTSIATNIASTWLYEKLKGRTTQLHINKIEVQVDNAAIQKTIEETIPESHE